MRHQKSVNKQLLKARLDKRWSQVEACERVGVLDVRTWQRWETEGTMPSPYYRKRLCEVFQCSLDDLFPRTISTKQLEDDGQDETAQFHLVRLTDKQIAVIAELLEVGEHEMAAFDGSKREALRQLLILAGIATTEPIHRESWERLSSASTSPTAMNADAFSHFGRLMEECWELGKNQLVITEKVLSGFLSDMVHLAPHQREAANIAAQGLRLKSILSAHKVNLQSKITLCQQAVDCARIANDPNALVASLTELAVAYKYAGRSEDSLKIYQEALYYGDAATPLLRTRVYAAAAAALAQHGRKREADFYIHLALDEFPQEPEHDPSFVYADSGIYMIAYYQGLMHLTLNQPYEANTAFESYKMHPSSSQTPERNRIEIINYQGKSAILRNDLEQYVTLLEQGITGAIALKSKKRFDEAMTIYQENVPNTWRTEPQIKRIAEQYHLPTKAS